jgi:hypothetical protein
LRIGVAVAVSVPLGHRAQVRAVELGADDDLVGSDAQRAAEGRGALGQQCRHAAVQDAVGLVNLGADLDLQHDLVRRRLTTSTPSSDL